MILFYLALIAVCCIGLAVYPNVFLFIGILASVVGIVCEIITDNKT